MLLNTQFKYSNTKAGKPQKIKECMEDAREREDVKCTE